MKTVSVLVAVHNMAKWLPRCLDSLLSQTYPSVEIICANDGSTDESWKVMEAYARENSQIKIIGWESCKGPTTTRNEAFKRATGEWVMMVDSDDWISSDAIEKAMKRVEEYPATGVVLFRLIYHEENGEEREFVNQCTANCLTGVEAMTLSLDWNIHGLYMARRALFEKYPYDTASRYYSDDNTTRRHYLHACEVRFCEGKYYYFQHAASVTHAPGIYFADWMEAMAALKKMLVEEKQEQSSINHIEERLWENTVSVCGYYWVNKRHLTAAQREELLRRIRFHQQGIETRRLSLRYKMKLGFLPLKWCFPLFMQQERFYFFLRRCLEFIKKIMKG